MSKTFSDGPLDDVDGGGGGGGGGEIASGRGEGGAGHRPGLAAAVSTRLSVRAWAAARDVFCGGGGGGGGGKESRLLVDLSPCGGGGGLMRPIVLDGGRGGVGVRKVGVIGEETNSSNSSKRL